MTPAPIRLSPGTLWPAMLQREQAALASGALRPILTVREVLPDAGARFIVRKVSSLERKEETRRAAPGCDPFLPYEPQLFVADLSDSHVALLNKFNVLEHHLLVVTRAYADQESLIDRADFEALAACMREFESLGFYNSGRPAGASQPHKHLQVVPVPLGPGGGALPIEALLEPLRGAKGLCRIPAFAFAHFFAWLPGSPSDAAQLHELYLQMLAAAGLSTEAATRVAPYNLLLTRRWMLVVPRSREHFGPVSVNALGFAGSLFVRGEAQMDALRSVGPMAALAAVTARLKSDPER